MGAILSPAGPYEHNPFVGNRPMKYPYTMAAKFAQFPFVYHWRYGLWLKPFVMGSVISIYMNYKLTKLSHSPSNVEEWKKIRKEWYTRKYSPEYEYH